MRNRVNDKNAIAKNAGLGMHHAIAALFMMGYAMGSPNVAPMLPPNLERPFANLHKEMHVAGLKAAESAAVTWQRVAELMPVQARASQASANFR